MAEYIVKSGDNLSTIAKNNNTTVQNLASLNKIADVNKIGVGQKLVLGTPNVPTSITSTNTAPATPTTVVQPQVSTGATTLQSDIISKGQADTARAVAEEAKIAAQQGTKAPTATQDVLKNILGVSTPTTPTTQTTAPTVDNTMATTNVNGITADKMATDRQFLADAMANSQSKANLTAQEYAGTVDPAKAELNQINQQMNEEALAGRRRTEAVLQIPGITKEQAQDKINEISRVNASKLADLAVVQMAKQGAYDSAKEISDRAVEAKYEQEQNKLDALKFTYLENKDLFTKAEQRAFEIAQDDRKRKLDAEKENTQSIYDLSVEASKENAPTSVLIKMRNAKTREEALAIGASYIGKTDRLYKQAQTAKIYSDIAESKAKASGTTGIVSQLNSTQQVKFGQLLDDFDKETKSQRTVLNSSQNIQSLAERAKAGEPTAQVALIFSYMKSLDPTSTVREGEYATAKNTTGLPGKVLNTYNSVLSGKFLNSKQIDGYVADSMTLANRANSQIQSVANEYDRRANVFGIPSGLVYKSSVGDVNIQQPQISPEKEQVFNNIVGIKIPTTLPSNTISNALFGNQATTNTIIPFNLNNFKTIK